MYAAVPRITPRAVIAGDVIVGEFITSAVDALAGSSAFPEPEVQHLHHAVGADFDVGRLQIAVHDALLMRCFERLCDLLGDGQRLVQRYRSAGDALREIVALDQLHRQRRHARGSFDAVDLSDVRVVQRGQNLRFALKPSHAVGVAREGLRQRLEGHLALEVGIGRPIHLAHAASAERQRRLRTDRDGCPSARAKRTDYTGAERA